MRTQANPAALFDSEVVEHGGEDSGFGLFGIAAFWRSEQGLGVIFTNAFWTAAASSVFTPK